MQKVVNNFVEVSASFFFTNKTKTDANWKITSIYVPLVRSLPMLHLASHRMVAVWRGKQKLYNMYIVARVVIMNCS